MRESEREREASRRKLAFSPSEVLTSPSLPSFWNGSVFEVLCSRDSLTSNLSIVPRVNNHVQSGVVLKYHDVIYVQPLIYD